MFTFAASRALVRCVQRLARALVLRRALAAVLCTVVALSPAHAQCQQTKYYIQGLGVPGAPWWTLYDSREAACTAMGLLKAAEEGRPWYVYSHAAVEGNGAICAVYFFISGTLSLYGGYFIVSEDVPCQTIPLGCAFGTGGFAVCPGDTGVPAGGPGAPPATWPPGTPVGGGTNPNAGSPGASDGGDAGGVGVGGGGTAGGGGGGDAAGSACTRSAEIGNPVSAADGNKYQREVDYDSPSGLSLVRHYNSSVPGWTHNWKSRVWASSARALVFRPDGRANDFSGSGTGEWTAADVGNVERLYKLNAASPQDPVWRHVTANDANEYYDAQGRLMSVVLRGGRSYTLAYDSAGLLQTVNDAFGRTLQFLYDASGRLVQVTAPGNVAISYRYQGPGGALDQVTLPGGATRQYQYASPTSHTLALTAIVDEGGNVAGSWAYDPQGRAISARKGLNLPPHLLSYGTNGSVTITDPLQNVRMQSWVTSGSKKLFAGQSTACATCSDDAASRQYDSSGLLAQSVDHLGVSTLVTNDLSRRLPQVITQAANRPESKTVQINWHPQLRLPIRIEEPGRISVYTYDAAGNKLAQTITDGASGSARTWAWTYGVQGLVESMTAPTGEVWRFTHDAMGNLTRETNPLEQGTTYTHDAAGRVLTKSEPSGLMTTFTYDARGRITAVDRGGLRSTYTYQPEGALASATLPSGLSIAYHYDASRRLTGWSSNRGQQVSFTLDPAGNRTLEQLRGPGGSLVGQLARTINSLNLVATETVGADQRETYAYDANASLTQLSNALSQQETYTLDGLRRLVAVADAAGATAAMTYDSLDSLVSAADFKGVRTTYGRNAFGEAHQETSPDIGGKSTVHDAGGLPVQHTDGLGQVTTITRDNLGHPTRLDFHDGHSTVLRYDLASAATAGAGSTGNLSEVQDRSGSTRWQHDAHGRVTQKVQALRNGAVHTTRHAYNSQGLVDTLIYPSGGRLQHLYDASGQLTGLNWNDKPLLSGIAWSAFGQPSSWTWFNGQIANRSYDLAGRLVGTEFSSYGYDAAGRIVNLTQLLGAPSGVDVHGARVAFATETFVASYDAVGRITSFVQGSGSQTSFNYDPNGNRLASTRTDGNAVLARSYTVDAASNRVLGFAQTVSGPGGTVSTSVGYTYNAAGDMTSNGLLEYGYDAEGRMASVSTTGQSDGATTRYLHNALGQRVFKSEPVYPAEDDTSSQGSWWSRLAAFFSIQWQRRSGNAEQLGWAYVYGEDGSLLGEYGNGGAQSTGSTQYIWMPTPSGPMPVAAVINGVPYAVHADHLLTPRLLTDGAGQPVWQWAYSAFGDEHATALTRTTGDEVLFNLRYPGQYFDAESGLHYNYFRSYDARTGKYLQPDPIGLQGGWSRFGYVSGNPLSYSDPDGLTKKPWDNWRNLTPLEGGGGGAAGGPTTSGRSPFGPKAGPQCPPEVRNTLDRIQAGDKFPHKNDGSVFRNKERLLPPKPDGYYREWVHPTPGVKGPGAQRVVTGEGGEAYYSPDHYRTFVPIP